MGKGMSRPKELTALIANPTGYTESVLNLCSSGITDAGVRDLAQALRVNTSITRVNLDYNNSISRALKEEFYALVKNMDERRRCRAAFLQQEQQPQERQQQQQRERQQREQREREPCALPRGCRETHSSPSACQRC